MGEHEGSFQNRKVGELSACLKELIDAGKLTKHRVGMNTVFKLKPASLLFSFIGEKELTNLFCKTIWKFQT